MSSGLSENGSIHELLVCHFFSNQQFLESFIRRYYSLWNSLINRDSFARTSPVVMHSGICRHFAGMFIGGNTFADQTRLDPVKWYMVLGSCSIDFRSGFLVLSSPVPSSYSFPKKVRGLLACGRAQKSSHI